MVMGGRGWGGGGRGIGVYVVGWVGGGSGDGTEGLVVGWACIINSIRLIRQYNQSDTINPVIGGIVFTIF